MTTPLDDYTIEVIKKRSLPSSLRRMRRIAIFTHFVSGVSQNRSCTWLVRLDLLGQVYLVSLLFSERAVDGCWGRDVLITMSYHSPIAAGFHHVPDL